MTRELLTSTALRLFTQHGHDQVPITVIADTALADEQGVGPAEASLAASLATACFDHAYHRWLAPGAASLSATLHDALAQADDLMR